MKTEFLKSLGLEQDAIDKIMAENGKDVNAEKAKTTQAEESRDAYKAQLDEAKGSLEKLKGVDADALTKQISDLTAQLKAKDDEYAAKEAERAFKGGLNEAITKAGGRNAKAIMAMLDLDKLRASKDQTADITAAIDAVKKSDDYLFGSGEPHKNPVGRTGGGAGGESNFAAMRALMGLPEKKA